MKQELTNRGYMVEIDTMKNYPNDIFGILERTNFIRTRQNHFDIFIEIHANGQNNTAVSGVEVYYPSPRAENPRSIYLADSIVNAINNEIPGRASPKDEINCQYMVLRVLGSNRAEPEYRYNLPAVLFEAGYLTNPDEYARLQSTTYINTLARLVCNGIDNYFIRFPARITQ